jgi:hypothetical protein
MRKLGDTKVSLGPDELGWFSLSHYCATWRDSLLFEQAGLAFLLSFSFSKLPAMLVGKRIHLVD